MRDTVWTFHTNQFRVTLEITPSFEPYDGDDEDGEIQRKLNDGVYVQFDSFAKVVHKPTGITLGLDSLCANVYDNPSDFYTGVGRNGYFRDMVREACRAARQTIKTIEGISLR